MSDLTLIRGLLNGDADARKRAEAMVAEADDVPLAEALCRAFSGGTLATSPYPEKWHKVASAARAHLSAEKHAERVVTREDIETFTKTVDAGNFADGRRAWFIAAFRAIGFTVEDAQ